MAELKIKADSGGGTVSFKGPATTTSNAAVQLTLPVDDGTANQYLKTDGGGALSWDTVAVGGATGTGYNDNVKISLGTGNDSEFYYSGTDNYFNVKNGKTFIRTGDEIRIQNDAETETIAKFIKDDGCYLYFNNGTKLSTTNIGVSVTGSLTPSSGIYLGGSGGSNWLDDYEEGTFDPTIDDESDFSEQNHHYIKIGSWVNIFGNLRTAGSVSGTGTMGLVGIPFTSANHSNMHWVGTVAGDNGWSTTTLGGKIASIPFNSTTCHFYKTSGDTVRYIDCSSDVGPNANLMYNITYKAA